MRIYLSMPITGYRISERKVFADDFRIRLEKTVTDVKVLTPFDNGLPSDMEYEQHMAADFKLIDTCDAVFFIGDYFRSRGCQRELIYANEKHKLLIFKK